MNKEIWVRGADGPTAHVFSPSMPLTRPLPLLCAGIELAASCGRAQGERGAALMLITTATGMSLGNTALGFLAGELWPFAGTLFVIHSGILWAGSKSCCSTSKEALLVC